MLNQMPDPWALPKAAVREAEVRFPHPVTGAECLIRLQSLADEPLRMAAALEEADELIRDHITGDKEKGTAPNLLPVPERVKLTGSVVKNLCMLRHMQPEDERCGFEWWLGMMLRMSDVTGECVEKAAALNKSAKAGAAGNSLVTSGKPSSKPRSRRGTKSTSTSPS
jgi:hypothetical protein